MRVLAELPHPKCKITIFTMNGKYIIKLEKGGFEQVFKISEIDVPDGVDGVFKLLDEKFLADASQRFNSMRQDFGEAFQRYDV